LEERFYDRDQQRKISSPPEGFCGKLRSFQSYESELEKTKGDQVTVKNIDSHIMDTIIKFCHTREIVS